MNKNNNKQRKTIKDHHGQRGVCANINCTQPRHTTTISETGIPTYRSVCYNCHRANIRATDPKTGTPIKYKKGVIRIKLNHCQNRYGTSKKCGDIVCRTEHDIDGTLPSRLLHLDEIDGNHNNTVKENIQTLCAQCHADKTALNGDHTSKCGNEFIGWDKDKKVSVLAPVFKPKRHKFF